MLTAAVLLAARSVLNILVLVLIYLAAFRRAADRHPWLRRVLAGDPPSALGTVFRRE